MISQATRAGWWDAMARRVREKEIGRQILHDRFRRAFARLRLQVRTRAGFPALLPELLKTLLGSILGFWILTALLSCFLRVKPVYALIAFGIFYSLQSTYYKYRLSGDPSYRIPRCGCGGAAKDGSEVVLRSKQSAILMVPTSALGTALYVVLLASVLGGHAGAAKVAAILAVSASAYLGYVMVARIGALCSNCVNVAALNVLVLWQLRP
jgi:uncharacterized membrane protein